jgi:hypothetical protein
MADAIARVTVHQLPISYPQELASRLGRLRPDDVSETCRRILVAGGLRWVIVGEASELVDQLSGAIRGKIHVVDSNSAESP